MDEQTIRSLLDCVVREEIDATDCEILVVSKSKRDGVLVHCVFDEIEALGLLTAAQFCVVKALGEGEV